LLGLQTKRIRGTSNINIWNIGVIKGIYMYYICDFYENHLFVDFINKLIIIIINNAIPKLTSLLVKLYFICIVWASTDY